MMKSKENFNLEEEDRLEMMGIRFRSEKDKKSFKKLKKEIRRRKLSFFEKENTYES